jgi:hypothetical protein
VHAEHAGHLLSLARRRGLQSTTRARRYELEWGISFSGESAKHLVAPMIRLMGRNLQIGVPPFGVVSLEPKRMCEVLSRIYGGGERVKSDSPYCGA